MAEKKSLIKEFSKGILAENPVLRLVLGTCPTLATTTSVSSAVGMGIAAAAVLVCSNVVISALRKVIPEKVRIPAYVVIIASFVTIVQMLVKAFLPSLNESLGVYLPLIVVNCIILGRAEAFAGKNPVLASAADGLHGGALSDELRARDPRRRLLPRSEHSRAVRESDAHLHPAARRLLRLRHSDGGGQSSCREARQAARRAARLRGMSHGGILHAHRA